MPIRENVHKFEERKRDHIKLALDTDSQTPTMSELDKIQLIHEALPELNFDEIELSTEILGSIIPAPIFISSMTAGHTGAVDINAILANVAASKGYFMGVGSQRRELYDHSAAEEWQKIRKKAQNVKLIGNIGLSQVIKCPTDDIRRLCDNIEAYGLFIHCNALQEVIQPEGTPQFKGGLKAITALVEALNVPVIIKETGCGFSIPTLNKLNETGVYAVDISGIGGTHWGRIEGKRANEHTIQQRTAETFKNWGISTVDTLIKAQKMNFNFQLWGSGGVRNGLDAAKFLVLGAKMVGVAKPMLEYALEGESSLSHYIDCLEYELKTALFCTGCKNISEFQEIQPWH